MKFRYIYSRSNPEDSYHFIDSYESVQFKGATPGCGCCRNIEDITKENLQEHIHDLEKDLKEAKCIMEILCVNTARDGICGC